MRDILFVFFFCFFWPRKTFCISIIEPRRFPISILPKFQRVSNWWAFSVNCYWIESFLYCHCRSKMRRCVASDKAERVRCCICATTANCINLAQWTIEAWDWGVVCGSCRFSLLTTANSFLSLFFYFAPGIVLFAIVSALGPEGWDAIMARVRASSKSPVGQSSAKRLKAQAYHLVRFYREYIRNAFSNGSLSELKRLDNPWNSFNRKDCCRTHHIY